MPWNGMRAYAAFIRAIGPETHAVMPQLKLCAACEALGLRDVKSYIASGNLYFSSKVPAAESSLLVSKAISQFGLQRRVFSRDAAMLDQIIADNPFSEAVQVRPSLVAVILFDDDFHAQLVEELLGWPGPEKLAVSSGVVYVDYVAGQGRSKINSPIIERRMKRVGTARNWNTILKMRALLGAVED